MGRRLRFGSVSVPDIGRPGLDRVEEVRSIANAIVRNVNSGRASKALGVHELRALKYLVTVDKDFKSPKKRKKALRIIEKAEKKIKR